jgi:hypothetical protein
MTPSPAPHLSIFYVNSAKWAALLILCCIVGAFGVWLIHGGDNEGWVLAIGGAYAILARFPMAIPGHSFLQLHADGFVFRGWLDRRQVRFEDIAQFVVVNVRTHGVRARTLVGWIYMADAPRQRKIHMPSALFFKCHAYLPDTYQMEPRELADLLESARQQWLATDRLLDRTRPQPMAA